MTVLIIVSGIALVIVLIIVPGIALVIVLIIVPGIALVIILIIVPIIAPGITPGIGRVVRLLPDMFFSALAAI